MWLYGGNTWPQRAAERKGIMKRSTTLASFTLAAAAALFTTSAVARKVVPPQAIHCTISPERTVLAADTPETAVVKVALTGGKPLSAAQRPAVNLALVIDKSSSMSGDKIERAKEAAIVAVERLDARDIVSVIAFSSGVETIVPAQQAVDKAAIAAKIRNLRAGGTTAIFGGVAQGASELRKHLDGERVTRLILLSDGQANVGPSSPAELGRLGASLVKESISVSSVGLGLGYNEDLMNAIAEKSDGNSYFVENSDDLPRVFSQELGDVLSVVAKDVKLRVQFKNGATPIELIGRDGRIEDGVVTVDFNQIYGAQQKYVLIRTEFTVGKDAETRAFADAEVTFLPMGEFGSGRMPDSAKTTASATINFSRSVEIVKKSVDAGVMKEHLLNLNAIQADRAIELRDKGDIEGATKLMRTNAARLRKAKADYGLKDLDADIDLQVRQEEVIAAPAFAPAARKQMRTGNMNTRAQQATE